MTSDSDAGDDKMDKNDTEWCNASLKAAKRRATTHLAKSSSNNKKLAKYSPLDYLQQLQKPSGSPVKKKSGRKPKFAPEASAQFANDENKTGLVQQQQQIRLSSNNSSRRTSDTRSNMSAGRTRPSSGSRVWWRCWPRTAVC
jgi:hypothetical protein